MNKQRKKRLESVISTLQEQLEELQSIGEEEREAFENIPENLQESDRVQQWETNADDIEFAQTDLENVIDALEEILDNNDF